MAHHAKTDGRRGRAVAKHAANSAGKAHGTQKTKFTFRYALLLALACTVGYLCVVAYLLATGYGLIFKPDATALYYTYFVWEGQAIRDAVSSILSGSLPAFSSFTLAQGYGADIIQTMASDNTNPLNLVSAFFPPEYSEIGYYLTIWARVVLAGLAFALYCFNRGKGEKETFVGALCYVFCGYMVFWGMTRHPGFMNTGILLPLVFMGADKIFDREKPYWFIFSVGVQFLFSVYFTYMVCMLLLGYCVIKYFFEPRQRSVRDFLGLVARFAAFLAIAFALGAATGTPYVMSLLSMDRVSDSAGTPLLFNLPYYLLAIPNLLGMYTATRGLYLGILPLMLAAVFVACGRLYDADERRPWLVALVLVCIMSLVPWFGHAINGFGYVSDRWMIGLGFAVAYIVVLTVPVLPRVQPDTWRKIGIGFGVLVAYSAAVTVYLRDWTSILFAVPFALLVWGIAHVCRKGMPHLPQWLSVFALLGVACASLVVFAPQAGDYAAQFVRMGDAYPTVYARTPARAVDKMKDDSLYRYSVATINSAKSNDPLLHKSNGISFYSSVYSQPIDDFRDSLGMWGNHKNFLYGGNDSRLAVDALVGAKYFVAEESQAWRVPYSYEATGTHKSGQWVYETENALPLAFTAQETVSREDYDALGLVSRQEALLAGVVLEDAPTTADIAGDASTCPVEVKAGEHVTVEDGRIIVTQPESTLELSFKGAPDAETYLCFQGLKYAPMGPVERVEREGGTPTLGNRLRQLLYYQPNRYQIIATMGDRQRTIDVNTTTSTAYVSRNNWAVNFGYAQDAYTHMTLDFTQAGIYTFDSLAVECQPVKPVAVRLSEMQKDGAADIQVGDDLLKATFKASREGAYAVFTVPYSTGWSARVDGVEAPVLQGDVGFVAVSLDSAGTHQVELAYATPGFHLGLCIMLAGILVLVAYAAVSRRSARRAAPMRG